MPIHLPLDQMTVAEKLEAMEAIWASLCHRPSEFPAPKWHEEVLAEPKRRLASGEATISDWGQARKRFEELGQ